MTINMTEDERATWRAAYAAYFVAEFFEKESGAQQARHRSPFDRAVELATAEGAIIVADLAVIRLREWKRDENADAGIELDLRNARTSDPEVDS